jgi:probable selenium-dependent hydroxylase accessory protein YqeC
MIFAKALGLETARLIALCGSGGKTSLMFRLAAEFRKAGERVLVTTTTKLALSELTGDWTSFKAPDAATILSQASRLDGMLVAYRAIDEASDKAIGFPLDDIDLLARSKVFGRILVEADGSAKRPLKAPAAHEPVFLDTTSAVVMVAGLSGLGRPLSEDFVFRLERWCALTGQKPGDIVTPEALARVILHPDGLARGAPALAQRILFLNQADTSERVELARQVCVHLNQDANNKPGCVVMGRLKPDAAIHEQCA